MEKCLCCGSMVPRCRLCWRVFVPENRSDEKYCRRLAPGKWWDGKRTCKDVGRQATYLSRLTGRAVVYRALYQDLYRRMRRNGLDRSLLAEWCDQAKARGLREDQPVDGFRDELLGLAEGLGLR